MSSVLGRRLVSEENAAALDRILRRDADQLPDDGGVRALLEGLN